jgi:hypothetical protein
MAKEEDEDPQTPNEEAVSNHATPPVVPPKEEGTRTVNIMSDAGEKCPPSSPENEHCNHEEQVSQTPGASDEVRSSTGKDRTEDEMNSLVDASGELNESFNFAEGVQPPNDSQSDRSGHGNGTPATTATREDSDPKATAIELNSENADDSLMTNEQTETVVTIKPAENTNIAENNLPPQDSQSNNCDNVNGIPATTVAREDISNSAETSVNDVDRRNEETTPATNERKEADEITGSKETLAQSRAIGSEDKSDQQSVLCGAASSTEELNVHSSLTVLNAIRPENLDAEMYKGYSVTPQQKLGKQNVKTTDSNPTPQAKEGDEEKSENTTPGKHEEEAETQSSEQVQSNSVMSKMLQGRCSVFNLPTLNKKAVRIFVSSTFTGD